MVRALNAVAERVQSWPLWASALAIYGAIRLLVVPAFLIAWPTQGPNRSSYPDGPPTFLQFIATSWDGVWYERIATEGYPAGLPVDPDTGVVDKNAWAFFPLFPFVVRGIMTVTRLPWEIAGPATAFAIGAGACVALAYLVRRAAPDAVRERPGLPLLAVAALNAFPTAATLSVAYSESTALLMIVLSLLFISRRQYLWALLPVVGLGFARAAALPMAVVVVWHAWRRWRDDTERPAPRAIVELSVLFVVAVGAGFAWPLLVGWFTGVPDAYFQTQSAWRLGDSSSTPFLGFAAKIDDLFPGFAIPGTLLTVAAIVWLSFTRKVRALGPELQAWGGAYLLYLVAVGTLSSSLLRFALLAITPQLLVVSWWRRRWIGYVVLALMLVTQYIWVQFIWVYVPGDSQPP